MLCYLSPSWNGYRLSTQVNWIFSLYSPVDPTLCPGECFSVLLGHRVFFFCGRYTLSLLALRRRLLLSFFYTRYKLSKGGARTTDLGFKSWGGEAEKKQRPWDLNPRVWPPESSSLPLTQTKDSDYLSHPKYQLSKLIACRVERWRPFIRRGHR